MQTIDPIVTDSTACPICGKGESVPCFRSAKINSFLIVRCMSCGLVYAAPRPTDKQTEGVYSSDYFSKKAGAVGYDDYGGLPEINAKRMWHVMKQYARNFLPTHGQILDMGCATGVFLAEALTDGWDCTGIDISQPAAEIARSKFGLKIYTSHCIPEALRNNQFDVVTMWHILEHLKEPLPILRQAREALRKDGLLFIEAPNWNSFGRLIRGIRWSQLKPPEHINFFTPRILSKTVESAGFRIVRRTTEYPNIFDKAKVSRLSQPFYLLLAFFALGVCAIGRGGYIRILARKI